MGRGEGKANAGAAARRAGTGSARAEIESLVAAASEDSMRRGPIDPAHRYLVIYQLDDETQPFRLVRSAADDQSVEDALLETPEGFVGEHVLDLEAPRASALREVYDDGSEFSLGDPEEFDPDQLIWA